MAFQISSQERADQVEKLRSYFEGVAEDEFRAWLRIEHDTGIKMDDVGKGLVRRVLPMRSSVRGEGVVKAGPKTAMGIVEDKLSRIRGAVKRARKTTERVSTDYAERLPSEERQRLTLLRGFFGAVRAALPGCGPKQLGEGKRTS
jgi:hypothetical protein